jgi:OmpA-OmpF porin, OOP family
MSNHLRFILLFLLLLIVSNCAKKTMVVLVPDPDGTVGSITVSNQAGSVTMDTANQSTTIKGQSRLPDAPVDLERETIDTVFSEAIAIQPLPPAHFILYFEKNAASLTPESTQLIADILMAIKERNARDISVVGHTDTKGNKDYNLKLSTQRAHVISKLLVERGIDPAYIRSTSHGEENPLVKTEDNVSEPINRRVEVVVR